MTGIAPRKLLEEKVVKAKEGKEGRSVFVPQESREQNPLRVRDRKRKILTVARQESVVLKLIQIEIHGPIVKKTVWD